jgi:hypothetical protein
LRRQADRHHFDDLRHTGNDVAAATRVTHAILIERIANYATAAPICHDRTAEQAPCPPAMSDLPRRSGMLS